jgi:hypothetical protein
MARGLFMFRCYFASLALSVALLAGGASAQGFPEKQVILVVPFPAGGATDPVARALASRMSELWKARRRQPGRRRRQHRRGIGRAAAPDGCTLLIGTTRSPSG